MGHENVRERPVLSTYGRAVEAGLDYRRAISATKIVTWTVQSDASDASTFYTLAL
jgi:hypothetical protein